MANGFFLLPELLRYEEPERAWLIPRLLQRGAKMIVGGSPKTRKSFLVNGVMHALVTGGPVFGNPDFLVPRPTRGLLFSQELHPAELIRRWELFLGEAEEAPWQSAIAVVPKHPSIRLDTREGLGTMRDKLTLAAERLGAVPDWVVLDPLSKFHLLNENDQQAAALLMRQIEVLQSEFGNFAAIIIHHFGHPTEEKTLYRSTAGLLRGSSHFYADLDSAIAVFYKDRGEQHKPGPTMRLEFEARHGAPVPDALVQLDPVTTRTRWLRYVTEREDGQRPGTE